MKSKLLLLLVLIFSFNSVLYADDISDILNKEKARITNSDTKETTKAKETETTKVKETETTKAKETEKETTKETKESSKSKNKPAFVGVTMEETENPILSEYSYMTLSDLIAEEIISLNYTKYDYSVFMSVMNIDKSVNFIINEGDAILNSNSDKDFINKYVDKNDFVVFSKFNKKNNSINVKVLKDNNTSGTLSIENYENTIVSEENTSTNSNIKPKEYDVVKSEVDTPIGNLDTFGVDKYGNAYENDPNAWIGEDAGDIAEEIVKKITNTDVSYDPEVSGIINVNIDDSLELGNSNLKIVLVDDKLSLYSMYIYYRNNYCEKLYLPFGKYKINEVFNLNSEVQDLKADLTEFTITKEIPVELKITRKENVVEETKEIIATESIITETPKKKSILPTILMYVVVILALAVACFGVKKFIEFKTNNF